MVQQRRSARERVAAASRRPARLAAALALVLTVVAGCSAAEPAVTDPVAEVAAFVEAWQSGQIDTAAELTTEPEAASQLLRQTELNLSPTEFAVGPASIDRTSDTTATAGSTVEWTLGRAGAWSYDVSWSWLRQNGRWLLDRSPSVIHPQLGAHQGLIVRLSRATDGTIVDRNDVQLVNPVRVYSILALKDQIPDVGATANALVEILGPVEPTLDAAQIAAGIDASTPEAGYTVLNLREESYLPVADRLAALTGVSTPSEVRNLPPARDFARSLLGQVTPVAAEMTAGSDGWRIVTVDAAGAELATLAEQPAEPGQKVTLTIDTTLQRAADEAVAFQQQPAAIVAIQPSTGEILAVAQNAPADAQGTIALTGRYPPGSTFKIVTATAGVDVGGLGPASPVECPGVWTVQSRPIRNSHDFALGTVDLTTAFAKSCNTTFAQIGTGLPADTLHTTALQYGVGLDFDVAGIVTLTGQSPVAESPVQRAENGFGQGTVLLSPFSAALMAASVANGRMPMPLLIRGTETTVDREPPAISAAAAEALPVLMRAVTESGTGQSLRGYGDIRLKTGTAEFADETGAIHAHAWTVGYVGDLAFAAFIAGGEDSLYTNILLDHFLTGALR